MSPSKHGVLWDLVHEYLELYSQLYPFFVLSLFSFMIKNKLLTLLFSTPTFSFLVIRDVNMAADLGFFKQTACNNRKNKV